MSAPIITLLSDFGSDDVYVAVMKAMVLRHCPTARLVDGSHAVPPQSVAVGGWRWAQLWPWFPAGTVHLAVVDPGVGTDRRILVASCAGHRFVCPDNGLLDRALAGHGPAAVVAVDVDRVGLTPASGTFHGRDIMGPLAGMLAAGRPVHDCGATVEGWRPTEAARSGGDPVVIDCDHFGNLITDCPVTELPPTARFRVAGRLVGPAVTTYAKAAPGSLIAVVGSDGRLEIAEVGGSAARRTGLGVGALIETVLGQQ